MLCQQLLARKAGINQVQLGALGACGLQRLVRELELAGTESSSRGRVVEEAEELRSQRARLANVFEPLRHLVHETHFFAVRDVCEREYGERHHGPKFEEGLEFCPRAGTHGVGERVDAVITVPSRESAAEDRTPDAFDAFVGRSTSTLGGKRPPTRGDRGRSEARSRRGGPRPRRRATGGSRATEARVYVPNIASASSRLFFFVDYSSYS